MSPTSDPSDKHLEVRELEATVSRLSTMIGSAPSFFAHLTLDGKLLYLNKLSPGFRMEEVLGTSVLQYLPPDAHPLALEALRLAAETRETQSYSSTGKVSPSEIGHYVTQVAPVVEDDVVTSLVMIATEVTDLVRARADLEESRARLGVAVDATGLGIWTFDPIARAGTWDPLAARIFDAEDRPAPELERLIADRIHPEDRQRVEAGLEHALATGIYEHVEHRILLPDGRVRWVAASGRLVTNADGSKRVIGGVRDITAQRTLEARLLEAQKLEGIGRLAGGIAHDFNNLLTAILGNLDVVLSQVPAAPGGSPADSIHALLQEARFAAERSAALTSQLLGFARRQRIEPRVVDPGALVSRMEALLRRLVGVRLDLRTEVRSRCCVRVDPSQLEQVVLNLATNARDAMPGAGTLTLRVFDASVDQETAKAQETSPGPHVGLAIRDTGGGIPPEHLPRLFEPFFSTRPEGTGLGLATCYGIAKQNGGFITVDSEVGRGTTVTLFLPAATGIELEEAIQGPASEVRGERVLVVEDQPLVRNILERTLRTAGYDVRSAGSPAEALALAAERPVALLVTDLMMPGMDGRELARRLRDASADLGVVLISGYSDVAIADEPAAGRRSRFLQKPFLPDALLAVAREVLDERS